MIELAARTWKLSIPSTITKLSSMGLNIPRDPKSIGDYLRNHIEYRKRFNEMWATATGGYLYDSPTAQRLLQDHNWGYLRHRDLWSAGPGKIYGAASAKDVMETFYPGTTIHTWKMFTSQRKSPWDDVLVIPFYDLPGRICAFNFIGRKGDPAKDYVYHRLNLQHCPGANLPFYHEAGLSMHPQIFDVCEDWKKSLVAIGDPRIAIHLQSRHCEQSLRTLPIIAWEPLDDPIPKHSWRMFAGNKITFWCPTNLEHRTLAYAIKNDGLISLVGPDISDIQEYLWHFTPQAMIEMVQRGARPWAEVLIDHFSKSSNNAIEELMLRLTHFGVNAEDVHREMPRDLQERVGSIMHVTTVGRTVTMNHKSIVERDGGWFVEGLKPGTFEMIMGGQLRIDAIVHQPLADKSFYHGRLILQGEDLKFCAPMEDFERAPMKYLKKLAIRLNKGPLFGNRKWNDAIIEIAYTLHPPRLVQGIERVGWDNENLTFIFPHFRIDIDGEVYRNKHAVFPDGVPAKDLTPPEALSGQELNELAGDNATSSAIFATITAILSNILAPAFEQKTRGIGLHGAGVEEVARVVQESLGCAKHDASYLGTEDRIWEAEKAHGWPVSVSYNDHKAATIGLWAHSQKHHGGNHNCIVPMNWYLAMVSKMAPGWHVIEDPRPTKTITPRAKVVIRKFIPAYLKDLCKRQLKWYSLRPNENWFQRVLDDVVEFVRRGHGSAHYARAARAIVSTDSDIGDAEPLIDLTTDLLRSGNATLRPESHANGDNKMTLIRMEAGGIAIPKDPLNSLLVKRKAPLGDYSRITAILMENDVLVRDGNYHWIVDEDWWQSRAKMLDATETGRLRVI